MNLNDYMVEVTLGHDSSLSSIFNVALEQVFSQKYLNKINTIVKKRISLKYVSSLPDNINAYSKGSSIYVNRNNFEKLDPKQQIRTLLHEFIHVLQTSKKFLIFFRNFKEIHNVSKELSPIVKANLIKPLSVFLNSKFIKSVDTDYEILPYMMSGNMDWSALKPEGKQQIITVLRNSEIFNLHHPFWNKRIA